MSRIIDWNDRTTCVLFGDGAGAIVLAPEEGNGTIADRGVLSTHLFSDGRYHDGLYVDGGPSSTRTTGFLRMQGREVFRHAITNISQAIQAALEANHLKSTDVDWFVPHQANSRILEGTVRKIGLEPEKVVVTLDRHGNTSAASVPLAMAEAVGDGRIRKGQLVLAEAMGGGFTWGSALIRW
jgi:3-oxoacyl-[acyl-carrier-protein] synthase III